MNELERAIKRSIVWILRKNPFYGHLISYLRFQFVKHDDDALMIAPGILAVFGVTPDGTVIVSEKALEFFRKLAKNFGYDDVNIRAQYWIIGHLMHEILHLVLEHHLRGKGRDNIKWNLATDALVNYLIAKEDDRLIVPSSVMPEDISKLTGVPETSIIKMNAEEIYRLLSNIKSFQSAFIPFISMQGGESQGSSTQSQSQSQSQSQTMSGRGSASSQQKQKSASQSGATGQKPQQSQNQQSQGTDQGQGQKQIPIIKVKVGDKDAIMIPVKVIRDRDGQGRKLSKEDLEEIREIWRRRLIEAYKVAKQAGTVPGFFERLIEEMQKPPEVDWRSLLYKFIEEVVPVDVSYEKLSKRSFINDNILLPGTIRETISVIIALDASASISNEEYATFVGEVINIIRNFHDIQAVFIIFDAIVQKVIKGLSKPQVIEALNDVKMRRGYGGTEYSSVFKYVAENVENARVIIFFTDGYPAESDWGYSEWIAKPLPVIFVITDRSREPPFGVPVYFSSS